MDIPVEFGWITLPYLPQPPVRAKTPLSTILRSVGGADQRGVSSKQGDICPKKFQRGEICAMASVRLALHFSVPVLAARNGEPL